MDNLNIEQINKSYTVLIPKTLSPQFASDFWPLSLGNELYKIFAWIIANRLKKILLKIIDESQSAFLPGRQIQDNIIIALECIKIIQLKKTKNQYKYPHIIR